MPRYFFHLRDDRFTADEVGEELADAAAAGREALRIGADLLRDSEVRSDAGEVLGVVCTDDTGDVVSAVFVTRPTLELARDRL